VPFSIQNHGDFFLCFQLPEDDRWYLTDPDTMGFFSFGPSAQAVVEVVALKGTELLVSCSFLDECPEVLAGNALSYRVTVATRMQGVRVGIPSGRNAGDRQPVGAHSLRFKFSNSGECYAASAFPNCEIEHR
jgi:hypothetical protein